MARLYLLYIFVKFLYVLYLFIYMILILECTLTTMCKNVILESLMLHPRKVRNWLVLSRDRYLA
ncbi:hypothetical protein HYPSUDRAFT_586703 [Hypholoma sublateritium FD-334 SS-4]|uniref:Uncharacterized protein n=1 Tax=Hypholoma sublateritium (strain FD-334 SS-4) TaxID=945553 RepID=A0A0D2P402_HYPSF|nr:hypothetical protein HYPSUDRAFT_586703 [Hypholoma sublateritium FD-334 SS-4]